MAQLIGRKVNKAGVVYDPAGTSILYAEDWNNVADQTESVVARVAAIETSGAPGSAQLVRTASGNPTMTINITSGVEVSVIMDANATVQLQYTADANNYGVFFIKNQPGGTLTWPNISWDTIDGVAPPLSAGDGIMSVIGIYERFGTLRGFLIDKNIRVAQPALTVPVAGGVLQLRYDEGSGMPRDTSGKANHPTVFTGTWQPTGGVNFTNLQDGHTGTLLDFNPTQSHWIFEVVRDINLSHIPSSNGGTLMGLSGAGTSNAEYMQFTVNADGTGFHHTARSALSADWSQIVLPNTLFTPLHYRTAFVSVYDAGSGIWRQYCMNNSDRTGYATSGGLKWAHGTALYNLAGIYRKSANDVIARNAVRKEYTFIKQGLPTDQELIDTYNFCKTLFSSRSGDNLP